ncbi:MAG: acyltransferase family protein, partial [Actinomycetota bacterium]
FLYPAGFLIVQAATAGAIVLSLRPGLLSTALDHPVMRWLGTRSYGIYLWHWPLVVLTGGTDQPRVLEVIAIAAVAIALGDISYRFVERPAMTKTGWARRPMPRATKLAAPVWGAAALALVVVLANTATVDPIEESLLAGEEALQEQDEEVDAFEEELEADRAVTGTTAIAEPVPGKKGKVPTAGGPKKGTVKLTAVGDSVMLGAAARMKSRFGKEGYVDAVKNRRFSDAVDVIKKIRKKKRLADILIVHLGNNGVAKKKEVDAIMKEAKDVDHVLFVTIRVNRGWQDGNNEVIKDADKRFKNASLVNWYRTSKGHDDWFYSDSTHMNSKGAEAYTKLIAASLPKPEPEKTATPKPKAKPTPTPGILDPVLGPP